MSHLQIDCWIPAKNSPFKGRLKACLADICLLLTPNIIIVNFLFTQYAVCGECLTISVAMECNF